MTTTKLTFADKLANLASAIGMFVFALFALVAALWLAVHAWSSVDCTINPMSERCVYLDKAAWERFK